MDKRNVERLVNEYVEVVGRGDRIEDQFVECKASFIADHGKAARQIGALANAAHGQDAMWIVGLSEAERSVVPFEQLELANWWAQVKRRFAEVSPDMQDLTVNTEHGVVTALHFETDRSPYLVTTDGHGGVEREVPWRSGTATRSATRAELLSSVLNRSKVPELELIDPLLYWDGSDELHFTATLFVSATSRALLPRHKWAMSVRSSSWRGANELRMHMKMHRHTAEDYATRDLQKLLENPPPASEVYEAEHPLGVLVRTAGLVVNGSDSVHFRATGKMSALQAENVSDVAYFDLDIELPVDRGDTAARWVGKFRWRKAPTRSGYQETWILDEGA